MRGLIRLFLTSMILLACHGGVDEGATPPVLVQEEWRRYEDVFLRVSRREPVSRSEFEKIRRDLWELTGIRLADEPTNELSRRAFEKDRERLKVWYTTNRSRLYWDSRGQRIRICTLRTSRGGLPSRGVDLVWRAHLSVLEDIAAGKPFEVTEFSDAHAFFYDLTKISIPADHSSVVDLVPTPESKDTLPVLIDWYSRNKSRVYWDQRTGTPKLRSSG